jgi:hypothetical protein
MNLDELEQYASESNASVILDRADVLKMSAAIRAMERFVRCSITEPGAVPYFDAMRDALAALEDGHE